MKRASYLILSYLILSTNLAFAQNDVDVLGEYLEFKDAKHFQQFLGEDKEFFYSLRYNTEGKGYNYFIEKYNKTDFKRQIVIPIGEYRNDHVIGIQSNYVVPYDLSQNDGTTDMMPLHLIGKNKKTIKDWLIVKDKIYIFSKKYVTDNNTITYVLDLFDLNDGKQIENEKLMSQFDSDWNGYTGRNFHLCLSPDSTKIGIISQFYWPDKPEDVTYDLYELDSLSKIKTKKMPNEFQKSLVKSSLFKINNKGDLIYFFRSSISKVRFKMSTGILIDYIIIAHNSGMAKYTLSTDQFTSLKLKANLSVDNCNYQIDEKNNVLYFYSMASINKLGLYFAKIDGTTLSLTSSKVFPFSKDIIKKLIVKEVKHGWFYNMFYRLPSKTYNEDFKPFFQKINDSEMFLGASKEGSVFFLKPKRKTVNSKTGIVKETPNNNLYHYYYGDAIVVSKVNTNMELLWMNMIPRRNICRLIPYVTAPNHDMKDNTRMTVVKTSNSLKFIFTEHPKIEKNGIDFNTASIGEFKFSEGFNKTNCVTYSINAEGYITKKIIYENNKNWLITNKLPINLNHDKYIFRFRKSKGGDECFGTIDLK